MVADLAPFVLSGANVVASVACCMPRALEVGVDLGFCSRRMMDRWRSDSATIPACLQRKRWQGNWQAPALASQAQTGFLRRMPTTPMSLRHLRAK